MTVETPENISNSSPVTDAPEKSVVNKQEGEAKVQGKVTPSPAQDLRDIQDLLVNGIFPGQVAPTVVKSYQILEKMAVQIEQAAVAAAPQETK